MREAKFEDLVGVTLAAVKGLEVNSETVKLLSVDGREWQLRHMTDCCEVVLVQDVAGDVEDLIGQEILFAEESSKINEPLEDGTTGNDCSWTWTFYTLRTMKGTVSFRWLGESNGYYGEEVTFVQGASHPA